MTLILQIIADRKNLRKSFQSAPCLSLRQENMRSICLNHPRVCQYYCHGSVQNTDMDWFNLVILKTPDSKIKISQNISKKRLILPAKKM